MIGPIDGDKLIQQVKESSLGYSTKAAISHWITSGRFSCALNGKSESRYRECLVKLAGYYGLCQCLGSKEPGQTHSTGCPKRWIQDALNDSKLQMVDGQPVREGDLT